MAFNKDLDAQRLAAGLINLLVAARACRFEQVSPWPCAGPRRGCRGVVRSAPQPRRARCEGA
eukprot:9712779-Alexandrium_andersonii.AAC.1